MPALCCGRTTGIEAEVLPDLSAYIAVKSGHPRSGPPPSPLPYYAPVTTNVLGFTDVDGDGPRFGAMIGLVAVVVATVILVFFGIGYALGRLFL